MVKNLKVTIVLPAYNAEKTLKQTYDEIPFDIVDNVILVDDCSRDNTVEVAKQLGIKYVIKHDKNKGYGGNQKTCYNKALEIGRRDAPSRLPIHAAPPAVHDLPHRQRGL